jgi:HEAT repeat protein
VLTQSADPWLRSCAAYTIGELHLHRFAPVLETWAADQDPLLRAAAEEALAKLKDAATMTSGDSVI